MDPQTDEALVRRLKAGESSAFDEAYTRFNRRLYAFLARLMGRRDLAEDLLQETWLRLATRAAALRDDTRLGPWLFTVARNLTLSFRRWRALDGERLAILHHRDDSAAATAFDAAAASETERRLEAGLAALPAKYREVLLLVGVDGMPREDAAAILNLRPEALRQRLARACHDEVTPGNGRGGRRGPGESGRKSPGKGSMNTENDRSENELLSELRALPAPELAADAGARIHRRARGLFQRQARLRGRPWVEAIGRLYFRVEPALAASVVVLYLGWAIQTVIALKR